MNKKFLLPENCYNLTDGDINEILQQERNDDGYLVVENKRFSSLILSELPSKMIFSKCYFEDIVFSNECENFTFDNCTIKKSRFIIALLSSTLFYHCEISHCTFEDMTISAGEISHNEAYDNSFRNVCFDHVKLHDNFFNRTSFIHQTIFQHIDLETNEFYECNFYGAQFDESNPFAAIVNTTDAFLYPVCPQEGSFIAFKKVKEYKKDGGRQAIVKLLIPEDAKRSSATTRKCRASKAKVLSITDIMTGRQLEEAFSQYDYTFKYEVGKTIEVSNFDEDRWKECAAGIHFFMSKEEALIY